MLLRRIARPMLATAFVSEGWDAFRRPDEHVARTEAAWRAWSSRTELPAPPTDLLPTLVRVHGAATTVAGLMLAVGRAPRFAALSLAALSVPVALVNQPFGAPARETAVGGRGVAGRLGRAIGATGGVATESVPEGGSDRSDLRARFVRTISLIGAALLAGVDHEGRPGMAWRVGHARVDRQAAREARQALAQATRDAKHLAREARRASA